MHDQITIDVVFPSTPGSRRYRYLAPRSAGIRVGEQVVVESLTDGPVAVTVVEVHREVQPIPGIRLKAILEGPERGTPTPQWRGHDQMDAGIHSASAALNFGSGFRNSQQHVTPGKVYHLDDPPDSYVIVEGFVPHDPSGVMGWVVSLGIARPMILDLSEIGPPAPFPSTFLKEPNRLALYVEGSIVPVGIEAFRFEKLTYVSEPYAWGLQYQGEIWLAQLAVANQGGLMINGQYVGSGIFLRDTHGHRFQPLRGEPLVAISAYLHQPQHLMSFTWEGSFLFPGIATPGILAFLLPPNQGLWELSGL